MTDLQAVDWNSLPKPTDDGAALHLTGLKIPKASLRSTGGNDVDISSLGSRCVIYVYPMTGRPGIPLPANWDMIPGARGCTPQSCSFRDHYSELRELDVNHVFGLSSQSTEDQAEAVRRLHLPFPLLSDSELKMTSALGLPTFDVDGKIMLKRLTMIVDDGIIAKVFYPVFPPDRNVHDVMIFLSHQDLA